MGPTPARREADLAVSPTGKREIDVARDLRILFVNPCLRHGSRTKILPVGLAYVMTYVERAGYAFDLLDIDIHEYDDATVEAYVRDRRYDVVLYGSIVTHYAWIKWLTRTIKRHHPETTVVVGNSVAGSCVDVFMRNAPADVVVRGEGELTCLAVLDALRDGTSLADIEGIAYRTPEGDVFVNPARKGTNVNDLPMPNWDHFDTAAYLNWGNQLGFGSGRDDKEIVSMPVSTARGCAFRCTFCHFVFWDDPYRIRAPESVIEEVQRNLDVYGATFINFWDDLSFASLGQVERMLDVIESTGIQFEWSAAVRTDLFGREKRSREERLALAHRMRAAGCTAVGYSLESANAEILEMMNKKVQPQYFLDQVDILREAGITSNVSVVFGYPIETRETIRETFDMCLQARIYPSIGYLLPLPATGMYDHALKHGFITDEDAFLTEITERQDLCLNMTKMADDEILDAIREGARRLNQALEIGLAEENLVKTGGYKKHTNTRTQLGKPPLDPDCMKRNENDFSFNYSEAVFDMKIDSG